MAKLPQTLIVLALLGATAAAFAVTERLKLERSPITGTRVDRLFSPVCECAPNAATISFVLRQRSEVTVDVLDSVGEVVRTLVRGRDEARGRVTYTWDGRDEAGRIVPEARYRPRVRIAEHGRTIVLPNPIRVDTDADSYRWLFAGERGVGSDELLVLRAPETPGTYAVYVAVGRFADRAAVLVTEPDGA